MRIDNCDLEAAEHGLILGADVRAAAEGGNRHRVPVQYRQVVAVAPVWNNISDDAYILSYQF